MKWLWVLVTVAIMVIAGRAQDQVRPNSMGEMVIRAVPPVTAATVLVKASDYAPNHGWEPGERGVEQATDAMLINGYDKLARWMKEGGRPAGPSFVIFNEDPATTEPQNLTCKIGYPVAEKETGRHLVTIEHMPAMTAAVVEHQGSPADRAAARDSLGKWIQSRGYAPAGPFMEIYLNGSHGNRSESDNRAEIRWPVRRTGPARGPLPNPAGTPR